MATYVVSRERQFQSRTKSIFHHISLVSGLVISYQERQMEMGESELIFMRQLVGKVLVMFMDCHSFKSRKAEPTYSTNRKGIETMS